MRDSHKSLQNVFLIDWNYFYYKKQNIMKDTFKGQALVYFIVGVGMENGRYCFFSETDDSKIISDMSKDEVVDSMMAYSPSAARHLDEIIGTLPPE